MAFENIKNIAWLSKGLSPGQTRMRVVESSDSRSRLASNSHAISATLIDSRPLTSNLNMLKIFVKYDEEENSLAILMTANSRQLSTSFDPRAIPIEL